MYVWQQRVYGKSLYLTLSFAWNLELFLKKKSKKDIRGRAGEIKNSLVTSLVVQRFRIRCQCRGHGFSP